LLTARSSGTCQPKKTRQLSAISSSVIHGGERQEGLVSSGTAMNMAPGIVAQRVLWS
jgi:hypothetical protein